MKIAIVHTHYLGENFQMPSYLTPSGIKTVQQKVLSGEILGYKNHKAYADHHGYQFVNDKGGWIDTKPPDWVIWQAALRALKDPNLDADWIFITVNDIIFADFNITLESYLENIPDEKIMCSGVYFADLKWKVEDIKAEHWNFIKSEKIIKTKMISGWTHFIKKCPESIEFLEMLNNDTRLNECEALRNNCFSGDAYLSIWYNGYPEHRNKWHLISEHDIIRIPNMTEEMKKWNSTWNLEEYKNKSVLMIFATCCVTYENSLSILEKYTNEAFSAL